MQYSNEQIYSIDLFEIAIKGEIVVASLTVSDSVFFNQGHTDDFENFVKKELAKRLTTYILENSKHVLFTKSSDQNRSQTTYHARMSLVPKDTTQLLRNSILGKR